MLAIASEEGIACPHMRGYQTETERLFQDALAYLKEYSMSDSLHELQVMLDGCLGSERFVGLRRRRKEKSSGNETDKE